MTAWLHMIMHGCTCLWQPAGAGAGLVVHAALWPMPCQGVPLEWHGMAEDPNLKPESTTSKYKHGGASSIQFTLLQTIRLRASGLRLNVIGFSNILRLDLFSGNKILLCVVSFSKLMVDNI